MASKKNDNRKNIVIVGGGQGGVISARALSKSLDATQYNLVLINPLPYRILLPATLRAVVSDRDDLENRILVPYDKVFHNNHGEYIQASVASIHDEGRNGGYVVLDNGELVPYHMMILATGSHWPGPTNFPREEKLVKEYIHKSREQYARAKHVVIVGGGTVGIETAGEIRDVWPDKKITIVQSGSQLLNATYPDKFRQKALASVRKRNINVIFGDQVEGITDIRVVDGIVTRNGTSVPDADLVVACFGPRPNTGFIASSLGPDSLTSTGRVLVQPTLQLKSHPNIFAVGDIIDWDEQKQAAKATTQANIAARNILALLENKPLSNYKGSPELICVTNGSEGGFAYFGILWGIVLGDWVAKYLKAKTLMVSHMAAASGN